jgi:DNA recombination protein RmuC
VNTTQLVWIIVAIALSVLFCSLVTWLVARTRMGALRTRLEERDGELARERQAHAATAGEREQVRAERAVAVQERERLAATLDAERTAMSEKLALFEQAGPRFREAFAALSQEALAANNKTFLDLARTSLGEFQQAARTDLESRQQTIDQMVKPVHEGLQRVGETLQVLEKERTAGQATIAKHLELAVRDQQKLVTETANLVRALRTPQGRGQWGEMQLRRVVELAGMVEHCDFSEQQTISGDAGRLRPDLLVRLPGRKLVVVDSKAPLSAYLDAIEATDDAQREAHLDRHVAQVRDHIESLSAKDYAAQLTEAPDFVVMFLPGEAFFSAACQRDPGLIDFAIEQRVMPASPTTLITLLKAVAFGWRQERLAERAEEIRDLGQQLFERIRMLMGHFASFRRHLQGAVEAYNKTLASAETRVLPTARKLRELGAGEGDDIEAIESIDVLPRASAVPGAGIAMQSKTRTRVRRGLRAISD